MRGQCESRVQIRVGITISNQSQSAIERSSTISARVRTLGSGIPPQEFGCSQLGKYIRRLFCSENLSPGRGCTFSDQFSRFLCIVPLHLKGTVFFCCYHRTFWGGGFNLGGGAFLGGGFYDGRGGDTTFAEGFEQGWM